MDPLKEPSLFAAFEKAPPAQPLPVPPPNPDPAPHISPPAQHVVTPQPQPATVAQPAPIVQPIPVAQPTPAVKPVPAAKPVEAASAPTPPAPPNPVLVQALQRIKALEEGIVAGSGSAEKRIAELEAKLRDTQEKAVSALLAQQQREEAQKSVQNQTELLMKEVSLRRRSEEIDKRTAETLATDRARIEQLEQKLLASVSAPAIEAILQTQKDIAARLDALSSATRALSDRVDDAARVGAENATDAASLRRDMELLRTGAAREALESVAEVSGELTNVARSLQNLEARLEGERRAAGDAATAARGQAEALAEELAQRVDAIAKESAERAEAARNGADELTAHVEESMRRIEQSAIRASGDAVAEVRGEVTNVAQVVRTLEARLEAERRTAAEAAAAARRETEELHARVDASMKSVVERAEAGARKHAEDLEARVEAWIKSSTERQEGAVRRAEQAAVRASADALAEVRVEVGNVAQSVREVEARLEMERRAGAELARRQADELQARVDASVKSSAERADAAAKRIDELSALSRERAEQAADRADLATTAAQLRDEFTVMLETRERAARAAAEADFSGLRGEIAAMRSLAASGQQRVVAEAQAAATAAARKVASEIAGAAERRAAAAKADFDAAADRLRAAVTQKEEALRAECTSEAQKAVELALENEVVKAATSVRKAVEADLAGLRDEAARARAASESGRAALEQAALANRAESESLRTLLEASFTEKIARRIQELRNDLVGELEIARAAVAEASAKPDRALEAVRAEVARAESAVKADIVAFVENQALILKTIMNSETARLRGEVDAASELATSARDQSALAAAAAQKAAAHSPDAVGRLADTAARAAAAAAVEGMMDKVREQARAIVAAAEESLRGEVARETAALRNELSTLKRKAESSPAGSRDAQAAVAEAIGAQELVIRRQFETVSERLLRLRREMEGIIEDRLRGISDSVAAAKEAERRATEADRKVALLAEGCARRGERVEAELRGTVLTRIAALEQRVARP